MLLTFRRRKDKARDDIKIFFFFSLLLLIEMMIAAVLSLLLLLLSLSLSVCENNNRVRVFRVLLLSHFIHAVWESPSRPSFLFFSFWVSLKIKGKKKTQVLFFSFFFLSFLLRLSGATRRRRESYPRLLHLKYITSKRSPYAQHFHNT